MKGKGNLALMILEKAKKNGPEEDDNGLMKKEAGEKFLKAIQDNDADAVVSAMSDLATMMD
jgi:hypothetical protein|tara:strand:+ start:312 stop:494 length:183 start_codon:yes stop_codon:yes gene_type:complete